MTLTVLITGATAGFGNAIARRFVRDGHRVIATGRRTDRLDAMAAELGAAVLPIPLDVTDGPAVAIVRQEAVRLSAGGPGTLPATLVESRFLGTHTAVVVRLADGTLLHAVTSDLPGLAPGGRLAVEVPNRACTVLPLTRG